MIYLNHHEIIPPTPPQFVEKLSSTKLVPGAQRLGPLFQRLLWGMSWDLLACSPHCLLVAEGQSCSPITGLWGQAPRLERAPSLPS